MNRRLDRKLVALAAAYAVALNILLPVLGAILPAAASGAIGLAPICSAHGAVSDRGAPAKPQPARPEPLCPCGAACAMPGCGTTALSGGTSIDMSAAPASVALVGLRQDGQRVLAFWPGGSKLARGPPIG
ncbi:MAG TPA: hypothetical protein VG145_14310 [Xanthobacteraceae bacterium]|jgi:hypothetical protein|nr:hypothetical protein [Xanthobacteraceae bacterium]